MPIDTLLTEPTALADSDIPAAADPRIARAEARLCMLRELAEMGMELTRALVRQQAPAPEASDATDAAPAPPAPPARRDPADAFARLSRAVRLTLALEATTDDAIAALRAGASDPARAAAAQPARPLPADPTPRPPTQSERKKANLDAFAGADLTAPNARPLPRDYPSAFRNEIRDNIVNAINQEVRDTDRAMDMLDNLYERLWEGERYDDFVLQPLKSAVAAICKDLGLKPDWTRWTSKGWPPLPDDNSRRWESRWNPRARMTPRPRLYRDRNMTPRERGGSP